MEEKVIEKWGSHEEDQNIKMHQHSVSSTSIQTKIFVSDEGTPGFTCQAQIGNAEDRSNNFGVFLCCDWKTAWTLLYKPIDEDERMEIDKIVEVSVILVESESKV